MLDYTLECLAVGGVQEVYIVCCWQADQIKKHIEYVFTKCRRPPSLT